MDGWITVPNWNKFQHYENRAPVWIKVYTELNSRDEWRKLTLAERGVLIGIWLEYGRTNGQIRVLDVGQLIGVRSHYAHIYRHINALVHAGFIDVVASKPLALARSREKKLREEKNKPVAQTRKTEPPQFVAKQNVQPADPFKAIVQMIRNGVIQDRHDLDAEIAGYRLNGTLADELREMLPR